MFDHSPGQRAIIRSGKSVAPGPRADCQADDRREAVGLDRGAFVCRRPGSAAEQPVLVLDGLARAYGARTVVAIPSWTVATGQHSLILGPSGSGKSTLLHLIAGSAAPEPRPRAGRGAGLGGADVGSSWTPFAAG